jgi:hypothetical protein
MVRYKHRISYALGINNEVCDNDIVVRTP